MLAISFAVMGTVFAMLSVIHILKFGKNSLLDNPPQTKSGKTLLFTLIIVAGLCGMIKYALKIIQIKTREGFYNVGK